MSLQMQMSVSAGTEADIQERLYQNKFTKNKFNNIISQKVQQNSSINCKFYETDIFNQIKNMLDITSVIEYYGVSINGKGFACCPFHQEKTPSFKVYDDSFYCFGCGESGTVIDFVMRYFGISNIEAVKKLNDDFNLNLLSIKNHGWANYPPMRGNKSLVESFVVWEKRAFITVSSYFRALTFWGEQIFINHIEYFNKYLSDVENIVFVENMLDLMIVNTHDFAVQVEFYRTYGKAVADIERKFNC